MIGMSLVNIVTMFILYMDGWMDVLKQPMFFSRIR